MKFLVVFFLLLFDAKLVEAVEPNEMLENSELEAIAREIGRNLRCLVCQNEDIENSNADIAKDLRLLVREKLKRGESKKKLFHLYTRAMEILFYFLLHLGLTL